MSEIIKIIWDFLKEKIGKTEMLTLVICVFGVYIAFSYQNYVATPDSVKQTEQRVIVKLDKSTAKSKIDIIEIQLDNLQREKSELEDKVDVDHPKLRHIIRLKEVNDRIEKLDTTKKGLMNILEKQ